MTRVRSSAATAPAPAGGNPADPVTGPAATGSPATGLAGTGGREPPGQDPAPARPAVGRTPAYRRSPVPGRTERLDRMVLGGLGALGLLAGVAMLLASNGVFGDDVARRPTLPPGTRDFARTHGWFWPLVGVAAALVVVAALAWLLARFRPAGPRYLAVAAAGGIPYLAVTPGGGARVEPATSLLATSALARAVRADAEGVPGVRRARARIVTADGGPVLLLTVTVLATADLTGIRRRLDDEVLAHAWDAVGRDDLRAQLHLRVSRDTQLTVA